MCHWIEEQFRRFWEPSEVLFDIFLSAFFPATAVVVALRLAGVEGIAMTYFWIAVAVFALCAILTRIRIKMEPKDTRLDTLITKVDTLTKAIKALTEERNGAGKQQKGK
jgi:hypothetical protein